MEHKRRKLNPKISAPVATPTIGTTVLTINTKKKRWHWQTSQGRHSLTLPRKAVFTCRWSKLTVVDLSPVLVEGWGSRIWRFGTRPCWNLLYKNLRIWRDGILGGDEFEQLQKFLQNKQRSLQGEYHISPAVNDIIPTLNGSTVFLELDLVKGYHQLQQTPAFYLPSVSALTCLRWYEKLTSGVYSATEFFKICFHYFSTPPVSSMALMNSQNMT